MVARTRDRIGGVHGARVRVDEIEVGVRRDPVEQGVGARSRDLVPADVRQGRGVLEADRAPGDDAERGRAVLVAAVEQELEPEADPEVRPVGGDPGAERVDQVVPASRDIAGAAAPTPGTMTASAPRRPSPSRATSTVGADGPERLVDADEVAGTVVDDRDPRAGRHPITPGRPWSRRRRRVADRSRRRRAAPARAP